MVIGYNYFGYLSFSYMNERVFMPLFLWKKNYEIGIAEIDTQHRNLVGIINGLSDAMMNKKDT